MHRILNSDLIGTVLAAATWILIGFMVFVFVRLLTGGGGWIYLN